MPVWVLDSGSGNHLAMEKRLLDKLRASVSSNATMVRIARAQGPAIATNVVDDDFPGLSAHARVFLLKRCGSIPTLGRLFKRHNCSSVWNVTGTVLIDHAEIRHQ